MKKRILLSTFIALLTLSLVGCNTNSVLRETTGATYLQSRKIASWLSAADIECESMKDSGNPLIEGMDAHYKAFDIIGKDGNTYLLILRKDDNDFTAVLNSDGELLHGMIDDCVLPVYFAESGLDDV